MPAGLEINWAPMKCQSTVSGCILNAMPSRTLSIFNSYEKDQEEKLNFLDNLKSLNDVLMIWRSRELSLSGKILIFKTLALSKLLYACAMKVSSKFLIDQLNALQKKFIFDNKRPKIKHSTLVADYCEKEDIKMLMLKRKLLPLR